MKYYPKLEAGFRWAPSCKGGPGECFEICVVREDNTHGIKSHGWEDERKIYISGSGGPCGNRVMPAIWEVLVAVAEALAKKFNELTEILERGDELPAEFNPQKRLG